MKDYDQLRKLNNTEISLQDYISNEPNYDADIYKAAVVFVRFKDEELQLLFAESNKSKGKWKNFGGRYEEDNDYSILDSMKREVKEELGLEEFELISRPCRTGALPAMDNPKFTVDIDFFLAFADYSNLEFNSNENKSIRWFSLPDMKRDIDLFSHQIKNYLLPIIISSK